MKPLPRNRKGNSCTLHASCVAFEERAVLITGGAGAGKSALALQMMSLGAVLVADDRTTITRSGDMLVASSPATIRGMIEARGIGILAAETLAAARPVLVVDLDRTETERLPSERETAILGISLPLLHKVESAVFPAAIMQYLKGGRCA